MMWRGRRFRALATVLAPLALAGVAAGLAQATVIRFQTTSGNYDVRLYDAKTPLHVANILQYINSNRYDGTFVHRSAKSGGSNFVIQGGGYQIDTSLLDQPIESGWHKIPNFGTVTNEPGISNLRGTMALAKTSLGPSTGTSEWFINLNNNSFLDLPANNSFTVFGRVLGGGMTVVDTIANLTRVNASVFIPNGPGTQDDEHYNTAFSEVPIYNLQKVQMQEDVFSDDVVRVIDVRVLNIPDGDYTFDGIVNNADLNVWKADLGSTTKAEADGNGNGVVDHADFLVWQRTFGRNFGPPTVGAVPEPSAAALALLAAGAAGAARRRRQLARGQ
jgi:MYXO-CTERM domain-containing protein